MTYEEFQLIALETQKNLPLYGHGHIDGNNGDMLLKIKWFTGGMSGGNCWCDTPYTISGDDEPEFVLLDKLLENVAPTITMLQYKAITRLMVCNDESEYEYEYGNSSNYDIKTISLKLIYDNLVGWGYV